MTAIPPAAIHSLLTVAVLAATVILFAIGRFRSDLVALFALLALLLTGVLTPAEALSGFSNPVIFAAAGMFVISGAIVRTGLASLASRKILGVAGRSAVLLFMLVMLLAALIGSMVSNTGTVAIMMPIVVGMAQAIDESPSRFLMPLAFMSSIGGMFTLVGNSPNMVVNDVYVKGGFPPLTLFSFFPVGVVCFAFGMIVLAPAAYLFLSRRKNDKDGFGRQGPSLRALAEKYQLARNLYRIAVPADSPIVGSRLADLHLTEKMGVVVQEIARARKQGFAFNKRESQIVPGPASVVRAGDVLHVQGSQESVQAMVEACRLGAPCSLGEPAGGRLRFDSIGICELVVMSSSRLVKRTVAESGLREQFGLSVLSIQRGDRYIWEEIRDRNIESGDALLVQGTWENLARLGEFSMDWVVVGNPRDLAGPGRLNRKMPLVAAVIVLMIAVMALNLVPTVAAVMLAAVVLIAGGSFRNMDEAYSAVSWETLVLIAGLLPIALAMEKTGLVDFLAEHLLRAGAAHGPHAALAIVYAAASGMNILISTTPVALLIAPIAMKIALALGYSPLPFLFAVATAASMCFASPFSTPSNALVMSAGRYTFLDYLKLGLPMQVLMGALMVYALPMLFPFGG